MFKSIISFLFVSFSISTSLFAQNTSNSVGALVDQTFKGTGHRISSELEIASHPNSNQSFLQHKGSTSSGNVKEHYHHAIEFGAKCIGIPTNKFKDKDGNEKICGVSLGLNYGLSDGPYTLAVFCSCTNQCAAKNKEFSKLIDEFLRENAIGDIRNCYDCASPNGPWCKEKDKQPQPGGCEGTIKGIGSEGVY